jgi:hypothetical protein
VSVNKDMGDKHEDYLHAALGGRKTKGSGNQWQNPADGRHSRYEDNFALAWDGKSTFGKSVSITRDMLAKIVEQASPETPMIGVRFYNPDAGTARLEVDEDWALVPLDYLVALREHIEDLHLDLARWGDLTP